MNSRNTRGWVCVDPNTIALSRMLRKQAIWWLCPYGQWTEHDGSRVIFDRMYRPICRVKSDGRVDIVRSDEFIRYSKQCWFHAGFGPSPSRKTREVVTEIIERYGLAPELRKRLDLVKRGDKLPCWDGKTREAV